MAEEYQKSEQSVGSNEQLLQEFPVPAYEDWLQLVEQQLKGASFEKKLVTKTYEGISLQPVYCRKDSNGLSHLNTLPGMSPFVRGRNLLGYARNPWEICREISGNTVADFNTALRAELERGQTAVLLSLDKAACQGQDPDEAEVGDVGQGGVSVSTVDDFVAALDGINFEQVPLYIEAGAAAVPAAALLAAVAKRYGHTLSNLRGSLGADPLGTLAQDGTLPYAVVNAFTMMAHLLRWAKKHAPQLQVITIHSRPYSNGGATVVQELAFSLATAVEYLCEMQNRGLSVNDVAPRIRFSFSVGSNYFMEVAKLRAARLVWAKVVKAFGGSQTAQKMSIHMRTALWNKSRCDPYVNMLRVTTEAFAGAVGGADSMHTGSFDETAGPSDEFSRRIARNTQIILQNEAHLTKVVDPAGGSWYVENLTDEVGRKAWALFQDIESQGGMLKSLQAGFPQQRVAEVATQRAKNIATRKDVFIGANKYANLQEPSLDTSLPDFAAIYHNRAKQMADYRNRPKHQSRVAQLDHLSNILKTQPETGLTVAIDAALAGATLGEISKAFTQDSGPPPRIKPLTAHRGPEPFETLRAFSDACLAKTGTRPQLFLANIGPIPKHKPRADFATDFFQAGGFDVINNSGFASAEEAAQAALAAGVSVVVICGTDDMYPQVVPPLAGAIKSAQPETTVILAGYPKDKIDEYRAAGVDEFIHIRANMVQILGDLQQAIVNKESGSGE